MAVYTCECGLIISTSSVQPRCLRCLRMLGPRNIVDCQEADLVVQAAAAGVERSRQFCQATLGFRLNVRPVLMPPVRVSG